jgi:hypothetical protein
MHLFSGKGKILSVQHIKVAWKLEKESTVEAYKSNFIIVCLIQDSWPRELPV